MLEFLQLILGVLAAGIAVIAGAYKFLQWLSKFFNSQSKSAPIPPKRKPLKKEPYSIKKFSLPELKEGLEEVIEKAEFTVFLCGPNLQNESEQAAAALRERIQQELKEHNFSVYLGEDDGVDSLREKYSLSAHLNELMLIENVADAIILIGSSVGSFCELGLFSYKFEKDYYKNTDFILVLDEAYKEDKSYLNFGPSIAVSKKGEVIHGDFNNFNTAPIIDRLLNIRATFAVDA